MKTPPVLPRFPLLVALTILTSPSFVAAAEDVLSVKSPAGAVVAEITAAGRQTGVRFGGTTVSGVQVSSDKRRYSGKPGGNFEVKAADADGFKLRDASGKLLWKVKLSAGKVKISDNEEGLKPFEIASRTSGIKVERDLKKLGEVTTGPESPTAKVKDASGQLLFEVTPAKRSLALGVLLADGIPAEMRYIIMAELRARQL